MKNEKPKIRVADLIVQTLVHHGIRDTFLVTGGGAMHLNDAFSRNTEMRVTYCHHEQACSMAAESYTRSSGRLAAVNVTTGPGGINALNGVYGAYTDSIGMVVVSGQVKRETLLSTFPDLPLRQLGDQEVLIVPMVRSITKFACEVRQPEDALYLIEKALWIAQKGRPGPVWVDIPIDVQSTQVELSELRRFSPEDPEALLDVHPNTLCELDPIQGDGLEKAVRDILDLVIQAKRPVVLAGTGVRISGMHKEFLALIEKLGIPVLSSWNAHDVIPTSHPLNCGRPGTVGDRTGNFLTQTADVLLVLGCRLNIRQISYNFRAFAKKAKVIMVDIDASELKKPTLNITYPLHADLRSFIPCMIQALDKRPPLPERKLFLKKSKHLLNKYPIVIDEYFNKDILNPYVFMHFLFEKLREDDIIVTANGSACVISFQAAFIKEHQRLYTNSGSASMGYDLPAAIGAARANPGRRIICLAGDGSIMMNLQELQTILEYSLPIKIFVINNQGYLSIIESQKNNFPDNVSGCTPENGVSFPDFTRLGKAFGFQTHRASDEVTLQSVLKQVLQNNEPCLCDIGVDPQQSFSPKLMSRKLPDGSMVSPSPEDMAPFLPREELNAILSDLECS